MENYAVGYVINRERRMALLVKHQLTNRIKIMGFGAEISEGQKPVEALTQAFAEETGLEIEEWQHLATSDDDGEKIYYFFTEVSLDRINSLVFITEIFTLCPVDFPFREVGHTAKWLLPLIFDPFVKDVVHFRVHHRLEVK